MEEHLGMWTLSTLTGEIRKLADDGLVAAFSPDGQQVAFISGRNNEIWLMGAKGENARKLASAPPGRGNFAIAWSPDASRVAALSVAGADFRASTVVAYDTRNGAPTEILAEPRISAITWKADGHLLYARGAASPNEESYGLWELALDPTTGRPAGAPSPLASWMSQSVGSISASRDGRRVLVTRGRTRSNVYVGTLNAESTELTNVTQLTHDDRVNWPSAWTPDGRVVLFHSDRNGDFDLFEQALSDREARSVLLGPDQVRSPRLTPDGRWILYLVLAAVDPSTQTARVRLMRMPAGGGPAEQVLETSGNWGRGESEVSVDGDYFWSYPDFHCAAAARPAPCLIGEADGVDRTVFNAFDPERGRQREVARVAIPAEFLAWDLSADGTRLAYAMNAFVALGKAEVTVVTLADKSRAAIPLADWGNPGGVAWSRSGTSLFITNLSVRGSTLLSVDLAGRRHVLRDLVGKGLYLADPRPSADGRHLAFGEATLGSNAWLLEGARQ